MPALEMPIHEGRVPAERQRRLGDEAARVLFDLLAEGRPLGCGGVWPYQHAVAARLIDRLDYECIQVLEDIGPVGRVGGPIGRHIVDQWLLGQIEANDRRYIRIDRLIVGYAGADRI